MPKHIQESEFEQEVLSIDRVTRVVAGGRRLRFRAVVIVGNKKGKIGLGTGKANDVVSAVKKAADKAKKDMMVVPIHEDTFPHDIQIRYKSSNIRFLPAGSGTGVIAGSVMRKILTLAGYKNILSKSFGTSNKLVNAQATMKALSELRPLPKELIKKKEEKKENPKKAPVEKKQPAAKKPAKQEKAEKKETKKKEEKK